MENKKIVLKLGYLSAILCAATFIGYIICFIGILSTSEMYMWTDFENYLEYVNENPQLFKHIAQLLMMLFVVSYLILTVTLNELVDANNKIFSKLSVSFAIIFAALVSIHYFIQISSVRIQLLNKETEGLLQFIQGNPISASSSINMLGWTLFFGLSSLFIFPVFKSGRKEKIIRAAFLTNGISCLAGGIGFIFQIDIITLICMNLIMGAAVMAFSIGLIGYFKRCNK